MYAKVIKEWKKRPPQERRKWDEFSAHMFKDYEWKLTETGDTTMVHERYGTSMHEAEDLPDGELLTEVVTKYAERATQAEERMAHMEAKLDEKFDMISMQ